MGDCIYCGKSAGLLHSKHKECEAAHLVATNHISESIVKAFAEPHVRDSLPQIIEDNAAQGFVQKPEQRQLLIKGWTDALDRFIDSGVLDESMEAPLIQFMKQFSITKDELNKSNAFDRMVKAAAIRDVMHGEIPKLYTLTGNLPLNLQKTEQFVWAFGNTKYFEDKTRNVYVGRSGGFSVRVMKGLYYHTNSFKGQPVENTERQLVDTGLFVVTSKNIYFSGPRKSMRIPYPKIVSFQPFSNAIGVMRDATSAKPQFFATGDGWFTYNLVTNLAKL